MIMKNQRVSNWAKKLAEYIKENESKAFEWGAFDCCMFAAECCKIVSGIDPASSYRGKYKTEMGAKRVIKNGHGSLESILDSHYERININFLQRGDVCTMTSEYGKAVAVYFGGDWWGTTDTGVKRINCTPEAIWRVEA